MVTEDLARRIVDIASCLRFFSRWPVPSISARDDPAALPDLPRAAAMIPLAGAILALPAAAAGALLAFSGLPSLAIGLIVTACLSVPTGGLHEDGLADTADGLFGGSTVERRLEIMHDSRLGSFGTMALVTVTVLLATLYGAFAAAGWAKVFTATVAAGALSRLAMVWLWWAIECARTDGLSARLGRPDFDAAVGASLIGVLFALLLVPAFGFLSVALALVLTAGSTIGVAALARARIGGQTGDVLGATQKVAEAVLLVGLVLIPGS